MNPNIPRLRMVVETLKVVEQQPPEVFDMETFGTNCGTSGCVAYHFCKQHPDEPLKLARDRRFPKVLAVTFNGKEDFDALGDYFGLDKAQQSSLFGPLSNPAGASASAMRSKFEAFIEGVEAAGIETGRTP